MEKTIKEEVSCMKKVILVCTDWEENYWEAPREAPYPKTSYRDLKDWDELVELVKKHPLPGLGIYIKEKEDLEFVYIKIKNMRRDDNEQPYFEVEPIKKASVKSRTLIQKLPGKNKKLFSSIDSDTIIKILQEIGEKPPKEWSELLTYCKVRVILKEGAGGTIASDASDRVFTTQQ